MASVRKRKWTHNGAEKEAWVVSYTDQSGKRRLKTFDKKKDADAFRLVIDNEIASGGAGLNGDITVAKLAEQYLRHNEHRVKEGRIGRSRQHFIARLVDNYVLRDFGRQRATAVDANAVEDWYRSIIKVDGLAPATARDRVKNLSLIFEYGVSRKWFRENPARECLTRLRGVVAKPIRTFTRAEFEQLIRAVEGPRRRWQMERSHALTRCAVHLAAFCGLRRGEIFGLTLANIDFDAGYLRIRHNLTDKDELKSPKTDAGVRNVPLPRHLRTILQNWLARYYQPNPRDLVFQSFKRPKQNRRNASGLSGVANFYTNQWVPLLKDCGLYDEGGNNLHFHALRHFAASLWIEHNVPLSDIASMMGHSKFDTTLQIYAHPIIGAARQKQALETAAELLLPIAGATREQQSHSTI